MRTKSVPPIQESGLLKRTRLYVHVSTDQETARSVGRRHGKPFIFEILAKEMFDAGFEFFLSENGVWLTDHVPSAYFLNHQSRYKD